MDFSHPAAGISRASGARVASKVRLALVPKSIANANVRRRASEQFLAQNLHTTTGRTGVLIFVSVAEQRVEIIADSGIDARVPKGTWQNIVDEFTREIGDGTSRRRLRSRDRADRRRILPSISRRARSIRTNFPII